MKIDLQKSLENVRKQMGVYTPTAADAGKIDLNKSLETVRTLQQQQKVLTAQRLEEDKRKARKMQTSPLSARAAETLAGLQEGGAQKQQTLGEVLARPTPSYPRLSIGERVGQTLAGLQEGTSSTTPSARSPFPVATGKALGGNLATTADTADQYGRGVIQNKIDELRNKGLQTDENGLGYFDTPEGEAELNAGLHELQSALRVLTGQDVTISGLAAAQDVLDSTPTINWGRWAQVDANAGQAMQAIEDRKDTEARSAYEDYYNDWLHLMEREDFAEKSRYRSTATGEEYKPGMAMFGSSGFGDLMYDYINKNQAAVERQQLLDTTSGFSALGLDQSFLQTMNDTEVGIYNYLYATEGRDRANEYLQYIQNSLTARQRQQTQDWFRQYAQENPVKASAFSVLQAPARGLAYLGQTADLLADGKIDQNAAYNKFADIPSTIRETVSQNWGPEGSFLYQTGMSMADFLLTLGISGGSNLSLAIMGSGAAADTVIDAKDRGLSDAQAFTLGTVAGVAEALTEKVSIESLLDMTTLGKSAVGYIVKNALAEAGEEASSGIINLLTDIIVSRDKSQWQQEVDRYFAQGMTKKQAVNLALMNQAKSIGLDALGGALSGGLLAGGGAITNRVGEVQRQQDQLQSGLRLYGTLQELQEAAETPSQSPATPVPALPEGEPRAGAVNEQRVDISRAVNQQGFEQAQNMPVQNNAQAETENADIMETPVEMREPEEIRNAREMIAQYEANGGALNGQQEGSVFAADGSERQFDQSAGKQARSMESRAVEPGSYANQGAVAAARQNRLRNLEPSRTSAEWLNLDKSRFDTRKIKMFPDDLWDSQMQQTAQKAWDKGVEVQFYAGTLRVNGTRVDGVNLGDGRVLVQADSQQWSVEQLTDHELMHTYLADEYGLRDEMLRNMEGMDVDRLNSLVASYIAQYNGVIDAMSAMTDEELNDYARGYVIDEIICDAYAGMNRRGWGAVKFSETVRTSYDNRVAGRDVAMDQDVRGPPEMRYSVNEGFTDDIDEWNELGRPENYVFVLGSTGEVLQGLGAIESDIYMNGDKISTILAEHPEMTLEQIKQIPQLLDDPTLILKSKGVGKNTRTSRVVVFGSVVAENGQPVLAVLDLQPRENGFELSDMQKVNSAYTKKKPAAFLNASEAMYVDEKRTAPLLRRFGLTIASRELLRSGYVGSITYNGDAVNIEGTPWGEVIAENKEAASGARYSVAEETEEDAQELETAEQAASSEPERVRVRDAAQARKELRMDLMNLFSVPAGMRKEAGEKINEYARQILERGKLSTYDRDMLFDILHNYGEMVVPASEYKQALREAVKGATIYVSDEVKAEFGGKEEWNEFRREAFGAGIILTNDPSRPGWDEWNKEMALLFPGAFDEYETDPAFVLRNIVNVAEQGKSDRMTLAEYAFALSEEYGPEVIDDYYMNMERQMDQLLNNFADKARFETKLRERTEGQLRRDAEYRKDQREKQRETRQLRELQQKTLKQLQFLSKNRHKAPKDLQKQFEEVLSDIDVFAVSAANEMNYSRKYEATWKDLADMYEEARENDPNWLPSKDLERIITRLKAPKLEDFNYNELHKLYQAALGLRQELYTRRNMLNDNRMFEEVYDQSVQEISESAAGYKGTARDHLMNLEQLTPMNVIERMAGWNPNSAWLSMGKQLEQGERDTKKFVIESNKMLQKFVEENRDWIATADGQGKKAVWIEKEVPELTGFRRGDAPIFSDKRIKIYMTPMMRVQLYMESKSYDNLNHMLGGRRFADKDLYTEAAGDPKKRREALAQGQIVRLTPEMVKYLCEGMSEQEMQLAHILGDLYYNEYSKNEINRVSNVLYGYDKAMSAWYTPIFTDQSFTKKEPGLYDATAEGAGNLKERVNMSTNPSLNLSAMDAFERSVAQTSKFVGMAIPVRNWNTLMNWRGQTDSMKNTIGQKWGDEMQRYLDDLVVRLQNPDVKDETVPEKIISGALSNYISAVFGLNPSVVAKQFGSFYMAMPYLGVNNLPTPKQIHNTDPKLIAKYSPELDDRLMGYAIPEVSQLKKRPNWSQKNKVVEFVAGGGAITAMDGWTAKTLWPWAENKVAKETGLQRGTDEFYKRVAIEFDNAIVRSQSINDVMHRSKLMNSQHAAARAFTMFKTDSAQSYNMLREAFGEAQYMKQHGTEDQKKSANRKAAQAVMGVLANNLWAAAITALINLWKAKGKNYRDDEGELTAASVAAQYTEDVLTSLAGTIIFGEEAADVIANWLGGDKFYGIELAGGDQLSDMVDEIVAAGNGIKEILVDGYYIVNNDGDLGEYFEDRAPDLIGAAKEMAQKAAKYLAGVPIDNLEAYLVGTLRWAAPQAVAAYEDALKSPAKAGLSGLEGKALETRMANILDDRMGGAADETVAELARLYTAGWDNIVPPEDADSIGERALTPDEQQAYRMSVSETVGRYLDDFISSENYAEMDDEEREQRIGTLYSYAKNVAKQMLTGEEPETNVVRIEDLIAEGMSIGEALAAYGEYVRADKLLEAGVEPEYVVDTTRAIREAEDANGPDESLNNLERYEIMLEHIGNETTRYAAMAGLMGEKEFARFDSGHVWVDSETYVKFQRAWKETYPDDKAKSQEKAKDLLKTLDLENDERAALWQMCNKGWKWEKNPFDRSIGKEIASEIEAKYKEIDGE